MGVWLVVVAGLVVGGGLMVVVGSSVAVMLIAGEDTFNQ